MKILKKIIDFYIDASIHVAFSCFSFVQITFLSFHISESKAVSFFAFFGTIVGYNFVKYDVLARIKKAQMRKELKAILILSVASFIAVGFCFFQLERMTQFVSILILFLTLLYTLPFFPNKKNARNWAGVKIYIVALCWLGVTVFLPLLNANFPLDLHVYYYGIQRFILIFVLVLIFEIIDLSNDDPRLQTVPQQIGVKRTKNLGYILLTIFCGLAFLNSNYNDNFQLLPLIFEIGIAIAIVLFLAFANEKRSKYYTSFWVESVPILWWLITIYFQKYHI
ncbi:hypothetical protein [Flavobacterium sp.]|uniref:hypothetical protein n=1 Tax=Flavobacterium sp. TaxID=239 RepID=UPI0038FC1A16